MGVKWLVVFLFNFQFIFSQCDALNYVSDSLNYKGVLIRYTLSDSVIDIHYRGEGFVRMLPKMYSIACDQPYLPSFPRPVWKNDNFIGFNSGCGTYCFVHILAPLNDKDSVIIGGQLLIDTLNTIYITLYRDTIGFEPLMKVRNYSTGKSKIFKLGSDDFSGAILLENLHCNESHPNGFNYLQGELTLFTKSKKSDNYISRTFQIATNPVGNE